MIITPISSAIFAIFFVFLSINVIRARRQYKVSIGAGHNKSVERAMRVHANFAEYVPFSLLLIAMLEINNANIFIILILCSVLLAGRVVHAWGVSTENENFAYRVSGMMMTFSVIIAAAALNVILVLL